ncbi:hypothetical protein PHYSODRAFT_334211 [Phytophthora sojae]|uniref:Dynein heavy chain C-terminal domain-containing protein n=1 Tax=Phytophthora sojae (strain P6497) TaxID=1094619 RepID=G4ZM49_PHYSP|nr:hypothetical protein PHYSODRAFT_334211 [Phytophthora sojae]EGZ16016.1 hypothetical protein PHYSODRAFT_334211 [Phytophthora sojae]|eukprot:XP_009529765.1 hypothetical protein PHYSODRAFT_334211 [Phytophthora sojae]
MEHFTQRFKQWYHTAIRESYGSLAWAYLTALVQATCRAKNWLLDKSTLYTRVTSYTQDSQLPAAADSDTGCLGSSSKARPWRLVEELPILQVIPIEDSRLKLQNTFTPVYVTQSRRNAMGGVALALNTDY